MVCNTIVNDTIGYKYRAKKNVNRPPDLPLIDFVAEKKRFIPKKHGIVGFLFFTFISTDNFEQ